MKHLFTFRLAYCVSGDEPNNQNSVSNNVRRSGCSHAGDSEFSNDETSQYGFGESLIEGDRMTEYDATE